MQPEEMIEANKVINMGMSYKDMGNLEKASGTEPMNVTEIKKDGPSFIYEFSIY
jgi:hypothetical protein